MTNASPPRFVGIAVAKESLAIAVHPTGEQWSLPHLPKGFPALVKRLRALAPQRILVEATGGLEMLLLAHLAAAGLPVVRINPRQARACAHATGPVAQADAVDARLLAHVAAAVPPPRRPLPSPQQQACEALLVRRRQLVEMLVAEKNRLTTRPQPRPVAKDLQAHIAWLEKRLRRCDDD